MLYTTVEVRLQQWYIERMIEIQSYLKTILEFLVQATPEDQLPIVDAIFVFGHIDKRLPIHTAKLYEARRALKIIITGKGRIEIPEGYKTEAEYYASILKNSRVPESVLILEKESTNSLENILLGMKKCNEIGFYPKSLILCSVPPLLRRSIATFKKQFPEIEVFGSTFELSFDEYLELKRATSIRNPARLLGEFDRFKEYAEKGDMVPVEVPKDIEDSIERLSNILRNKNKS